MVGFSDLPNEVLLHIFNFLDHGELRRISSVNWRCNKLASAEEIWKRHCKKHWLAEQKTQDTWRRTFIEYSKEYGLYIDSYPILGNGWNKLKSFLQTNTPEIYSSLKDGLTEEELDAVEAKLKCKLPKTLRLFYRLCGGQSEDAPTPGLLGSLADVFATRLNSYCLLSPTASKGEQFDIKDDDESKFITIPLAKDYFDNVFCIILPKDDEDSSDSEDEPPVHSIVLKCKNRLFAAAQNFENWLLDHVEKVTTGVYPIEDGHILRYFYEPDCVARTGSIEVRAGWVASQLLHNNRNLLFEYRITMTMDEDANPRDSCKLLERHWLITHSNTGRQERISGPGVVGEFPLMKPGAKYSWMSRTYFSSPGGSMEGHFTMRSLSTSDTIEIECPRYNMPFPHEYKRSSDFEMHMAM